VRVLLDRLLFAMAGWLGALAIVALGRTLRIEWQGSEEVRILGLQGQKVIYAFWHGRMLLLAYLYRGQGARVLVSQHRDGEFIARIVARLGFTPVRGSTTRGGTKAFFELSSASRLATDLAITPDGPRGPRQYFQLGAVYLAHRTGLPIVPITWSAEREWLLSSWDGFAIPRPFSRCVIRIGSPIQAPPDADPSRLETVRERCEQELRVLTDEADRFWGRDRSL
jgi:lysophospholipid acyltransferase (LPLAT)-like uncharacterized protein